MIKVSLNSLFVMQHFWQLVSKPDTRGIMETSKYRDVILFDHITRAHSPA